MFPLHQHVYTIHTHNLQAGSDLANPTNTPWQMQMHCLQSQPLEVHLTSPRLTSPLNMLRLLLDHSFLYSQKTPPRFPDSRMTPQTTQTPRILRYSCSTSALRRRAGFGRWNIICTQATTHWQVLMETERTPNLRSQIPHRLTDTLILRLQQD